MAHKICFVVHELFSIGGEQTVLIRVANALSVFFEITIYTHEKNIGFRNDSVGLNSCIHVIFVPEFTRGFIYKVHLKAYRYYRHVVPYEIFRRYHKKCLYPQKMIDYWANEINNCGYSHVITVSGSRSYSRLMAYVKGMVRAKIIAWEHSSYEAYFHAHNCYYFGEESEFGVCWRKLDELVFLNEDIKKKFYNALGVNGIVIKNPRPFESVLKSGCMEHTIISVGRLEKEKGVEDIIISFANLHDRFPDWKLIIVGDGSKRNRLERLAKKMNIEKSIEFVGFQRNVRDYLLKASIFAIGSKWEGMPMTVLEAMECGLPIVGYKIPALTEMLNDKVDSFLADYGNREAFENELLKIMRDEKMRIQMGKDASINADNFALEAIIPIWKELLN